ncbi:hypothetical protein PC116_g26246 [Phytophthora cactorum]|nr:hypothetical protein Pcac1_g4179 [Phytophthora cactorum]KAG2988595.1 hypothetical protein PC119_g19487 [Phytophthora cactorum]KAG3151233.1 hypothetical protein C6341_g16611 [Phytophthora cactorum]KAG3160948.1 hypothetical protein PC128_g20921 [Phytophthora cactorum]KAG4225320.1 hypothetical protein PC116_g26246 [Phytophthora cactorum]
MGNPKHKGVNGAQATGLDANKAYSGPGTLGGAGIASVETAGFLAIHNAIMRSGMPSRILFTRATRSSLPRLLEMPSGASTTTEVHTTVEDFGNGRGDAVNGIFFAAPTCGATRCLGVSGYAAPPFVDTRTHRAYGMCHEASRKVLDSCGGTLLSRSVEMESRVPRP